MEEIFNTLEDNYIQYGIHKIFVIVDDNEELWFSGKDTALSLGYKDSKDAIKKNVDKDDIIRLKQLKKIAKKSSNILSALLKYMQMHAFAYILTRLFIALQLIALQ